MAEEPGPHVSDSLSKEVSTLYARAEAAIKHYELVERELHVPAVNQLRYAGHHLSKALYLGGDDYKPNLEKAANHCRRAYYDAMEAAALSSLDVIDRFFHDFFQSEHLVEELPDYSELQDVAENYKSSMLRIREGIYSDRAEMFDQIAPLLKELNLAAKRLEKVRPRLAKRDKKSARNFVFQIVTFAIAIAGLIIGLLQLFL